MKGFVGGNTANLIRPCGVCPVPNQFPKDPRNVQGQMSGFLAEVSPLPPNLGGRAPDVHSGRGLNQTVTFSMFSFRLANVQRGTKPARACS